MEKFEYTVVLLDTQPSSEQVKKEGDSAYLSTLEELQAALNAMGKIGWEIADQLTRTATQVQYVLKRKIEKK